MSKGQDTILEEPPLGDINKVVGRSCWLKGLPFLLIACTIIYIIFFMPYGPDPDGTVFGEGLKKALWFILTPTPTPLPTPMPTPIP